jgi:hypothetical protein
MRKPAMTLQDIERALEEQDRDLHAAYRTLTDQSGAPPIALPAGAIERLHEACGVQRRSGGAPIPASGIRC